MADFRCSYCKECGAMNYYCLDTCPVCGKKETMQMIVFYFDGTRRATTVEVLK